VEFVDRVLLGMNIIKRPKLSTRQFSAWKKKKMNVINILSYEVGTNRCSSAMKTATS
jgi:hypothetical protein